MSRHPRVGIYGAGAIGGYLGVQLSSQGCPVTMLARPSLLEVGDRLAAFNLAGDEHRPGPDLRLTEDPGELAEVEIVLLTVKSRHTSGAGDVLAGLLRPETPVVSLQNGLDNPRRLREAGVRDCLPGMVSFNVVRTNDGAHFRQATSGPVIVHDHPVHAGALDGLGDALVAAGDVLERRKDMREVQAGKLLLNLNNGICALTGLPIAASIRDRRLRRALAACMREALAIYRAAGIVPARMTALPPRAVARLLPLPDPIVLNVAPSLVSIDPQAKSSTLQDLERGVPTEIDDLNGALVALAAEADVRAPVNRWVTETIHGLERAGRPTRFLDPGRVWDEVKRRAAY